VTTQTTTVSLAAPPEINQRRVFLFWLPLAASWLLMAAETPFVNAAIARLGEAERMIAAFGLVASLSITIESPVIMLLATSTALARSRQSYEQLRRFTWHLMLATTLAHLLLAWTPLFDVVVSGWMGVPPVLLEPIRLGMRIMIFWSAAIAWRRFKQGVLIRWGQTRFVGAGTMLRLLTSGGAALLLWLLGNVSGVAVGALALSAGVIVEALYAQGAARPVIAEHFGPDAAPEGQPPLGYGQLVKFHAPLAASTLLLLLAQPLVAAALARVPNPVTALAAWPISWGLLFLVRAPGMALPETIIALIDRPNSRAALKQFCVWTGALCTGVLALIAFTPAAHLYFQKLMGVNETLSNLAAAGAQFGLALPGLMAAHSWLRGLLTARRVTLPLTLAMGANLAMLTIVLLAGVALHVPGVVLASVAMSVALGAEVLVLWFAARRSEALA
jgi:hypothetical protein